MMVMTFAVRAAFRRVAGAAAFAAVSAPILAAPADGVATFNDRSAFDAALNALGSVTAIVETYDALATGTTLPNGTVLSGITHSLVSDPGFQLVVRDPGASGNNALGATDGAFNDPLGFTDVLTLTTMIPYRAFSVDLLVSPGTDFLASDLTVSAGGLDLSMPEGAPGTDRLFFGLIAGAVTIDDATLTFDFPGNVVGDPDDVSFYSVTREMPVIPVPAALPLLAGAIGALTLLSRCRRTT